MASLIEAWRNLFARNELPTLDLWPCIIWTAALVVVGSFIFGRLEKNFADVL